MNWVDAIFAVLLLVALARSYSRGLLATAATYVAPVVAFYAAAEYSGPVRDRLAVLLPAADFLHDLLAPVIVFIGVVILIRVVASMLARLLGVGLSLPSRIVAGIAGVAVSAIVLGAIVLLARGINPGDRPRIDDSPEAAIADPIEKGLVDLNRLFAESLLAPPLAELASIVVSEAIAHQDLLGNTRFEDAARKAAEAAAEVVAPGASPKNETTAPQGKPDGRPEGESRP